MKDYVPSVGPEYVAYAPSSMRGSSIDMQPSEIVVPLESLSMFDFLLALCRL